MRYPFRDHGITARFTATSLVTQASKKLLYRIRSSHHHLSSFLFFHHLSIYFISIDLISFWPPQPSKRKTLKWQANLHKLSQTEINQRRILVIRRNGRDSKGQRSMNHSLAQLSSTLPEPFLASGTQMHLSKNFPTWWPSTGCSAVRQHSYWRGLQSQQLSWNCVASDGMWYHIDALYFDLPWSTWLAYVCLHYKII